MPYRRKRHTRQTRPDHLPIDGLATRRASHRPHVLPHPPPRRPSLRRRQSRLPAPEFTAITNQWINSYQQLTPGFKAPVSVVWACRNRSALVRIRNTNPAKKVPSAWSCAPRIPLATRTWPLPASSLQGSKAWICQRIVRFRTRELVPWRRHSHAVSPLHQAFDAAPFLGHKPLPGGFR